MIPSRLADAYEYLADGRAWVGCIVRGDTVATVASSATSSELLADDRRRFASPDTPKSVRAAFLIGGLRNMERELLA